MIGDTLVEISDALVANPVRALLTMAGVFWGTLVLVLMLGFAEGIETATIQTMRGGATNAVFVWRGRTRLPYRGRRPGRRVVYDLADVPALEAIPGVHHLSPRSQLGGYRDGIVVTHAGESGAFQITGDVPNFRNVMNVEWDDGRFINAIDIEEQRKVAVIGDQVYRRLWPDGGSPLGETIEVRGVFFTVVGHFHSATSDDRGDRAEQTIHIPLTTYLRAFRQGTVVEWFAFVVDDAFDSEAVENEVKATLADRHDVHPKDAVALGSYNGEKEYRRIQSLFAGIRGLTWLVGLATLLSGAIGVSNVLLIVVRERTSEIGVRRAIGATPGAIVTMIGLEALVMTGLAGMAGIVVATGVLEVAAALIGPNNAYIGQPWIHWTAMLGAAVLLAVAGLVAGYLPARRAVAIEPVDALRSE